MNPKPYQHIQCLNHTIRYLHLEPTNDKPYLIFLLGYRSNLESIKCTFLYNFAKENNYPFLSFEYSGHGESSGELNKLGLYNWRQEVDFIINYFTQQHQKIIIGSSLGGYLALDYCTSKPNNINKLILLAPTMNNTSAFKTRMSNNKIIQHDDGYTFKFKDDQITYFPSSVINSFISLPDARELDITQLPATHILHCKSDDITFADESIDLINKIPHNDKTITLFENEGHRLNSEKVFEIVIKLIRKH